MNPRNQPFDVEKLLSEQSRSASARSIIVVTQTPMAVDQKHDRTTHLPFVYFYIGVHKLAVF
jgi:hypothetical protein